MTNTAKPKTNPSLVLREEFDDWAVLFDPDSGRAYGLNPVSAFIWKQCDGLKTRDEILNSIEESCTGVSPEAANELDQFLSSLHESGLIGYEISTS